ncbi:hypothetical protein RHSIM_Rhsim04G0037300 [Rhododendron simsii]|uniref:Uncharacterized protein n=1 Tax=Rhododendron simsii TaxID=118357 RepID=A0A834H4D9_RHOSS|nr:hypothetical protein RHSIM_Rhsim04G0037300 [Rhododendron simsii]
MSTRDFFSCVTKIYAANLIHLRCISSPVVDFRLYDLSLLVDATIGFHNIYSSEEVTPQVLGLLSGVVNVKRLSITIDMLEGFDFDNMEGYTLGRVPSCFTSSLKTVRIAHFDEDPDEMWFISCCVWEQNLLIVNKDQDFVHFGLARCKWLQYVQVQLCIPPLAPVSSPS